MTVLCVPYLGAVSRARNMTAQVVSDSLWAVAVTPPASLAAFERSWSTLKRFDDFDLAVQARI